MISMFLEKLEKLQKTKDKICPLPVFLGLSVLDPIHIPVRIRTRTVAAKSFSGLTAFFELYNLYFPWC
jgi:hypothetical protein